MVTCQEKALENLKLGLFDCLPAGALDGLTSEDFRLLLNGVSRPDSVSERFLIIISTSGKHGRTFLPALFCAPKSICKLISWSEFSPLSAPLQRFHPA